jgi:uncharacterized protein
MIQRNLENYILKLRDKFPVLVITGPRQSGKTTLVRHIFSDYRYISLENPDLREFATNDPNRFLQQYNERVIFDEVQRVPSLLSYIQTIVDERKMPAQFILTGSQNFLLMESVSQSLAGRVALFKLLPLDFLELAHVQHPLYTEGDALSLNETLFSGGYPAIYNSRIEPTDFYPSYVETYLERDVRNLINIRDLGQFRRFLRLCAGRTGQVVNLTSLANDCGITSPTAKAWLSLLESSYMVFQLQPFYENFNKRITKNSKLYFYDTGLVCHLLGIAKPNHLDTYFQRGAVFENYIVAEIIKNKNHFQKKYNTWFWQDSRGNEIDLLIESGERLSLIEIKSGATVSSDFFKNIQYLEKTYEGRTIAHKIVVFGGEEPQYRTQADVIPWRTLIEVVDKIGG